MASSAGKSGNSYDYLIKLMLIGDSGEHPPANALALAVSCSATHGSEPAHPPQEWASPRYCCGFPTIRSVIAPLPPTPCLCNPYFCTLWTAGCARRAAILGVRSAHARRPLACSYRHELHTNDRD
jgi:hypothetical protein